MSETTDDKPAAPCKHCRGQPYDPRHIPGLGKTHDYEPAVRPPDAGDGRAVAPTTGEGDADAAVLETMASHLRYCQSGKPVSLLPLDVRLAAMEAGATALRREIAGAQKSWASAVGDAVVAAHVEAERDEWRRRAETAERERDALQAAATACDDPRDTFTTPSLLAGPATPVPAGYVLVPKVRLDQLLAYEMLAGPAAGAPRDGERRDGTALAPPRP
jgi:hypothetical protein